MLDKNIFKLWAQSYKFLLEIHFISSPGICFKGEFCYKIVDWGKAMENRTIKTAQIGALFIITILIISSTVTVTAYSMQKTPFSSTAKTMTLSDSSKGETELKYYNEEGLSTVLGIPTGAVTWKTAIRLTQDEMAVYTDWTMTKVNVAFYGESSVKSIDIRIYIYDNGTPTHPGTIIANDTTFTLDTTGVTTIPLVTPVNLNGHEELWVAIEWHQVDGPPGKYYAWLDECTGPAVDRKGDWCYLNDIWVELQNASEYDGNWGIGGIIEGNNYVELSLGNIEGPLGVKATLQNIGTITANDIRWSITISGGLHHRIYVNTTGRLTYLDAGDFIPLEVGIFFGLGKITIELKAKADNALEVSVKKYAFLLGPFVVGIR